MLLRLLLFCITTLFNPKAFSTDEPYCYMNDLPFDGDGWFINQQSLQKCFQEKKEIQTVIEVGSWLGASTRYLATLLPNDGKLYAIDTWLGSWSESQAIFFQNDPRLPYAYQLFLSNTKHAGLAHKIIPIRMLSLEAAKALNVKGDLIYIDACHEEESVYNDLLAWYPHLKEDGILCGDDWYWESVRNGVIRAASKLKKQIFYEDNFWKLYD
ncbi:MAG: class I SAM-dependent methyltransferase [Parachlamydiaceae bacterium]